MDEGHDQQPQTPPSDGPPASAATWDQARHWAAWRAWLESPHGVAWAATPQGQAWLHWGSTHGWYWPGAWESASVGAPQAQANVAAAVAAATARVAAPAAATQPPSPPAAVPDYGDTSWGQTAREAAAPSPEAGEVGGTSSSTSVELLVPPTAASSRVWAVLSLLGIKAVALVPHLIFLVVLLTAAWVVFFCAEVAVLFTGVYPPGIHAFVVGVVRWHARVLAFALGLTDRYPPFSLDGRPQVDHPVDLVVRRPLSSSRTWAANSLLLLVSVIAGVASGYLPGHAFFWLQTRTLALLPHLFILAPLFLAVAVAWIAAQAIVVVRGAYPSGLFEFISGALRWQARVEAYWFGLRDEYPAFDLGTHPGRTGRERLPN